VSPLRWLLTALSFAAAVAASAYVVWSTWPAAGGARVSLPWLAHVAAAGALALEILSRAAKIQLSAHALRLSLGFGAAVRVSLGGDFGAAITPARSGAEPARYLVLTEARVPPAGRLLILFTELKVRARALALIAAAVALVFRGAGAALAGLVGLVGGYAGFVLGVGVAGVALAKRNASGPPPRWAELVGLHAGRWRTIRRSLRHLRASVDAVRQARMGAMALAFAASVVHIAARALVLPALVWGHPDAPALAVMFFGSLALLHAPLVVPLPSGGGGIEVAFLSGFAGDFGTGHQVTMLLLWRFYTTILLSALGMYLLVRTHGAAAAKELFTVGWFRRRKQ